MPTTLQGWTQFARAGVLIGGPDAALGGLAAAHLLKIADPPGVIDVWSPLALAGRTRGESVWRFRRGTRSAIGYLPHASVEETVLDLCCEGTADDIASWLARALHDRITTADRIARAMEAFPTLPRRSLIRETLVVVSGGSQSPMEVRFQRDVEAAHGLPAADRQVSYSKGSRSDMGHDRYRLIVELDGMLGHRGLGEIRDARRDAEHLAAGFSTLRFGWGDVVDRPCETALSVARVLRSRGWAGELRPCAGCAMAA
ncbi:MAG: endonuclease domain-containing protein [Acidipropionibacterium sp.]|jgi:hypothetical protein|nr:endonuclease domain-containing protein [Acidipropionibacterium sp.]